MRLVRAWQRLLTTGSAACLALNLAGLRWEHNPDSLYLVANISAYWLQVVRRGPRVVARHRVVVSKAAMLTPALSGRTTHF